MSVHRDFVERRDDSFYLVGSRVPLTSIVREFQDGHMKANVKIEVDEHTADVLQARAAELGVTVSELVADWQRSTVIQSLSNPTRSRNSIGAGRRSTRAPPRSRTIASSGGCARRAHHSSAGGGTSRPRLVGGCALRPRSIRGVSSEPISQLAATVAQEIIAKSPAPLSTSETWP